MTLIQAQERLITRILRASAGQRARVTRAAYKELRRYLQRTDTPTQQQHAIARDAIDMAKLELLAD